MIAASLDPSRLDGKVAIVTGASRGIGAAAATRLAAHGATVVLAARSTEQLDAVAGAITAAGGAALAWRCDVTDEAQLEQLVAATVDRFGRLDLAFNNAGVVVPHELHLTSAADFDHVVAVNLRSVFFAMKYEIAAMLAAGNGGAIVNTASVGGHRGVPFITSYNATKHAVVGLTRGAALEYARRGIRINAVSPGATATEMLVGAVGDAGLADMAVKTPLGRVADPDEIARVVHFLLSDNASFIAGEAVLADGGLTVGHP